MKNENEIVSNEDSKIGFGSVLANVILSIMKKESNHDLNHFQCCVYSSFELACKINTERLTAYKVRKELKLLESKGYAKKSKFYVDNESNLMCWKWTITIDGYNIC